MTHIEFKEFVNETLCTGVKKRGWTLYSSYKTVQKGKLYLLGFNPGEDKTEMTIEKSLNEIEKPEYNEYTKDWGRGVGMHPIQKNVKKIVEQFGLNIECVCASNLIFERSHDQYGINYTDRNIYWKIHQRILEIVQPELIIAFGNGGISPYHHLKGIASNVKEDKPLCCGHGKYLRKFFTGEIGDLKVNVIGLPHLSRYRLYTDNDKKREVLEWMKNKNSVS